MSGEVSARRPFGLLLLPLGASLLVACATRARESDTAHEAREAMLFTIASQFRENQRALQVLGFEQVTWRDRCLEIRHRGICQREATPGYRLFLKRRDQTYEYRAPLASPTDVAVARAPDPRIGRPALAWSWSPPVGPCQTLVISSDARPAVGWCDGQQREEWLYFSRRFTPFQLRDGDRTLVFSGTGGETASPAWQRAVAAWAALRWSDLRAGRSGAAHGRAMAYRRPLAGRPGYCDILEVTEYGVAYAGASLCAGGGGETGRTAWLSDALWEPFSQWQRELSTYSDEARGVHFFGSGTRAPSESDVRLLADWARRAIADVRSR